ncbi:T9SS type B sorting domain-containing protein [Christiangramia sp. SM2212]|uniref:T9SS type B sorting domain-containing protein n=1 Tax=Christiangramia sediminicola TaxID=3073267 RepID=A0ABU1ER12_9FLAO|nr:T9SS type B sorting domain-containing protein [Christiangramia sp. SM2212]MDR5590831.1 T9SS type B sorting domain-containing protein [Christiangramia sp. SM2212]
MKDNRLHNYLVSFLLLFTSGIYSQSSVNDCSGAIKICGDGIIATNAEGAGTQEIRGLACSGYENNSIWLEVELIKSGTLGFDLIPASRDIVIDYDFWVFGPTTNCSNLGPPIRCSTTNPQAANQGNNYTGMRDEEPETSEGPGPDGDSYVRSIEVKAGETYLVVIDRFAGESSFKLEWTGTATVDGSPFPDGPEINEPNDLETCNANGIADFDLSQNNNIATQNNTSLSYHASLADASDNLMPVTSNYTSDVPRKTIYARVENDLTGCAKITEFDLVINDGPIVSPNVEIESCDLDRTGDEDYVLTDINPQIIGNLNQSGYEIGYFSSAEDAKQNLNPVTSTYNSEGLETLYARVSEVGNPDCYNLSEIDLILNYPPELESYSLVQPQVNSNSNTIDLNIENSANYEFSIGNIDGPYQRSTTFDNVESGFQTLYIRDLNQCAIISTEIAILGYDNFFTPNQDGINDFWQINGMSQDVAGDNLIHIYDRYGKLMIRMSGSEKGWDGIFNGKPMPAEDYWFRVLLKNGQEFNGHFSLVR